MKTRNFSKLCAALTSALMLSGMAAALPVSASDGMLGDLDGDGVLTGHDTAMLSRYLYADSTLLNEEQLKLADFNGDGTVDAADAVALHAAEVYQLGDVNLDGALFSEDVLYVWAQLERNLQFSVPEEYYPVSSQVQINLMDADGDGKITGYDCAQLLNAYGNRMAGNGMDSVWEQCGVEGCYYLHYDLFKWTSMGDFDGDGVMTDHDAVLIEYMNKTKIANHTVLMSGDINNDGSYDKADTDYIHQNASYTFETSGIRPELVLQVASFQMAGGTIRITADDTATEDGTLPAVDMTQNIYKIDRVHYNLMDVDGDNVITTADAYGLLLAYSRQQAGSSFYPEDGYSLA